MYSFCSNADIICPNVTEACFLTDTPYREEHDEEYAKELALKLRDTGAKIIVITGVTHGKKYGALCLDSITGEVHTHFRSKIPGTYYGTGDIFASALTAAYLRGKDICESAEIALQFTCGAIKRTYEAGTDTRLGVNFEQGIAEFINRLGG